MLLYVFAHFFFLRTFVDITFALSLSTAKLISFQKPIHGVNHWYWTNGGDSSLYLWPKTNNGVPIDYSSIFSPASLAPVDVFDVKAGLYPRQ